MSMAGAEESGDSIQIQELELSARVGVPDEERAAPQRLTVSIVLWPQAGFHELHDELQKTVNYAAVCREVKEFTSSRRHKLIETLAEEIAADLLRKFPIARLRLELRKFILKDVRYVAVTIMRNRPVE